MINNLFFMFSDILYAEMDIAQVAEIITEPDTEEVGINRVVTGPSGGGHVFLAAAAAVCVGHQKGHGRQEGRGKKRRPVILMR